MRDDEEQASRPHAGLPLLTLGVLISVLVVAFFPPGALFTPAALILPLAVVGDKDGGR